jgi:hypothetical protein
MKRKQERDPYTFYIQHIKLKVGTLIGIALICKLFVEKIFIILSLPKLLNF